MTNLRLLFLVAPSLLIAGQFLLGCSEKSVEPKTEFTEKDLQQIKQYQQQATDEWGNKTK